MTGSLMVVAGDLESLYEHLADGLSLLHTYLVGMLRWTNCYFSGAAWYIRFRRSVLCEYSLSDELLVYAV